MDLKIKVPDIPPEGLEVPLAVPVSIATEKLKGVREGTISLAEPLSGRLRVEAAGRRVVVRGRLWTRLKVTCDRCLAEFELPMDEEVFLVFTPQVEADPEELEAEALDQEFYQGEVIDLWPMIEEHLVLARPIKILCRDDCQGLCPTCGRNLNDEACSCSRDVSHPGLASLNKIRDTLPER